MKPLQALKKQGQLTPLDMSFAQLICRLAANESDELTWAAALASHATANGHACLDLTREAGRNIYLGDAAGSVTLPDFKSWTAALQELSVVGSPAD